MVNHGDTPNHPLHKSLMERGVQYPTAMPPSVSALQQSCCIMFVFKLFSSLRFVSAMSCKSSLDGTLGSIYIQRVYQGISSDPSCYQARHSMHQSKPAFGADCSSLCHWKFTCFCCCMRVETWCSARTPWMLMLAHCSKSLDGD
jgi:hypothetical protein